MLREFNSDASKTAQTSQIISNKVFTILAKTDHVVFKTKIYNKVLNEKIDYDGLVDDHSCRLGKWYYEGAGKEHFGNTKTYPLIKEPHNIVHSKAKENMDIIKNGFSEDMIDALVNNFKDLEKASDRLFKLLDEMSEEKLQI